MFIIKHRPEDFVVTEISNIKVNATSGHYLYFRLVKKNRNTLDAARKIAYALGILEKQVGFAGSKDKKALTEQVISITGTNKESVEKLDFQDMELHFLGYGKEPISLGDLQGNQFEITIRNLDKVNLDKVNIEPARYIPNYFDEQRFGSHNMDIGRHLVKKEFAEAAKLVQQHLYQEHLQLHQQDYVGALRKLPIRLLRMYVNAYQSYLWNETIATYLNENGMVMKKIKYSLGTFVFVKNYRDFLNLQVPLLGFGAAELIPGEVEDIIQHVLKKERITFHDFVIKQIPELSLQGELRSVMVEVQDLKVGTVQEDEFHPGKKKVLMSFTLTKGSYATMVVKGMLGQQIL